MEINITLNNQIFNFSEIKIPTYINSTVNNIHLFETDTDQLLKLYKIYKVNNDNINIIEYPKIVSIQHIDNLQYVDQIGDEKLIWENYYNGSNYVMILNNTTVNTDGLITSHLIFDSDKFYEFYQMLVSCEAQLQCSNNFKISVYKVPSTLIIKKNELLDNNYKIFEITDTSNMSIVFTELVNDISINNKIVFSAESNSGQTTSDLIMGNITFSIKKIK